MGKTTKYTKCILVTRCKSHHLVCLEKTRQMMKNVTMLNKKCSLPFYKGGGVHTIDGTKFFMECPYALLTPPNLSHSSLCNGFHNMRQYWKPQSLCFTNG